MVKACLWIIVCFCGFQLCVGGLFKKLFKGLPLNAAEKAYTEKIKKYGVRATIMNTAQPTRQELVKKHDDQTTSRSDRKLLERSSERAKISISRKLAQMSGKKASLRPQRRAIGGARPRPAHAIESSPKRRRKRSPSEDDGDGTGDADMLTAPGTGDAAGAEDAAPRQTGWRFDEAQKRKREGERAYLRRKAAEEGGA